MDVNGLKAVASFKLDMLHIRHTRVQQEKEGLCVDLMCKGILAQCLLGPVSIFSSSESIFQHMLIILFALISFNSSP